MRVKGGYVSSRRRKRILKRAKGYHGRRSECLVLAKEASERGMQFAFHGRKLKKRDYRGLWIIRTNAALEQCKLSYNRFIHLLKTANIALNRKSLSEIAVTDPSGFQALVGAVNKGA